MKLIGIRTGTQNAIGRLFDDDTVLTRLRSE